MRNLILTIFVFLYNSNLLNAQNPCSGVFSGKVSEINNYENDLIISFLKKVPHPDPRRCDEYYVCIFFIGSLQRCEANKIFDGYSGNCIPGDPNTCLPITSTTSTTTPPTTTTLSTTTTTLPTTTSTTTTPPPTTTSSSTTTTITTTSISSTSLPSITTSTQNIQTTTTPSPITTTSPGLNLEEICKNVFFGARPHPYSIYLFIGCIRGDGTILTCLNGEFFDSNALECLPIPCSVPENICDGIQLEVIPNPCSCYEYIVCYAGNNIRNAECEVGNIFDPQNREWVRTFFLF